MNRRILNPPNYRNLAYLLLACALMSLAIWLTLSEL